MIDKDLTPEQLQMVLNGMMSMDFASVPATAHESQIHHAMRAGEANALRNKSSDYYLPIDQWDATD